MFLEGLGGRIRSRREERGLKQADLANGLQVTAQAVSKWERGENAPDIALLPQISRLLDVSVDWLLGLSGPDREVFEATVMVSDICGFARKAGAMPPAEVAAWANSFFYHLTEAVLKHDGVPVKQMGDGLLAFFTGPNSNDRAMAAARRAVTGSGDKLRVAITSGEIYLGSIGHPGYAQPDITGSVVNEAFLLLGLLKEEEREGIAIAEAKVIDAIADPDLVAGVKGPKKRKIPLVGLTKEIYEIDWQGQ